MKKIFTIITISLVCVQLPTAQLSRITDNLFGTKENTNNQNIDYQQNDSTLNSDSLELIFLKEQILQMKMTELLYLEELEKTRSVQQSDSIRQNQYKTRIDSLRKTTAGIPLIIHGDTLFKLYTSRGGVTPTDRILSAEAHILELGKTRSVRPDSIYLLPLEGANQTEIMFKNKVIVSVTKDDALWMNMSIDSLAAVERGVIVKAVRDIQKRNSMLQVFKRIFLFILVIAIQYFVIKLTNKLYRKFKTLIIRKSDKIFKPIVFRNYEFLNITKQVKVTVFTGNILRYILIFIQLMITVPILFSIFPQTKNLANKLFGYIFTPIKSIFGAILDYIPNLFVIAIIWLCIRYLVKGILYIAKEIDSERLKITGFYPDWAMPTFNILKFLLYAFMIAMIYPYLPGSDAVAFKGVSIFVGVIVSLGSSTVVGNLMAGLVMTYMRPFKIGDRIKLNETIGNVIEKSPFVTRIKTPKNEIITIPNSQIMSSQTTNYSASARDYGLILHSNISIGYSVPWQKAHECLIRAAKETEGVLQDREPFVLDLGLEDYYNSYQINVYISDADMTPKILTRLHSKIQDIFLEEGIEIESPMLVADRR